MSKTQQKASGSKSKSFFIIVIIMSLIAGLCGVAGYTFYELNKMKSTMQSSGEDKVPEQVASPPAPPVYVTLEPFTVSLKPTGNDDNRVLYIGLTLRLKDEKAKAELEKFMPEVRSRLLLLFSQQTGENLATEQGKIDLMNNTKEVTNRLLAAHQSLVITDVLFNAFILR
ncbi:flagellar basal body-associated protein FliL [Pantoea sp. KPR_PJ]|uniref:flagellar basal body-associated protein FliL n=1 Tax=Pantoea sp. KPR_PJ TaxID=2738375 RepID=UPI0035283243